MTLLLKASFMEKVNIKVLNYLEPMSHDPHKIASGVNFKQLQLFIQGREVLMTKFRHWR